MYNHTKTIKNCKIYLDLNVLKSILFYLLDLCMTFGDYISYINISDTKNKEQHILENCLSMFKTFFLIKSKLNIL